MPLSTIFQLHIVAVNQKKEEAAWALSNQINLLIFS
jgi:hypothetical protein